MSRTTRLAAVAAASAAAVTLTASPALAWTGGAVSATLVSPLTVSLGSTSCSSSTLSGSVNAAGALTINTAAISGCTGTSIIPQNLPWGGNITNGGGPATLTGFRMSIMWLGGTCVYGGTLKGTNTAKSGTPPTITLTFINQVLNKISGGFCPSTITISVTYKLVGAGL